MNETMNEDNMERKIREALEKAVPEYDTLHSFENDVFAKLDNAKRKSRRNHIVIPVLVISLLFLSTAAAYTATHLTTVSEWLGITDANAPQISTPIKGTDDVSFELTGMAYQDNTLILAIHATPAAENILLYPSDRLATGLGLTAQISSTIQGIPEPYGNLPLDEYLAGTGQKVCWTLLMLTGPEGNEISNAKWIMQQDGSMMIFLEIVPVQMEPESTLKFRTVTASMSNERARSFSRSELTKEMLRNGSRDEFAVTGEQCLFTGEPEYCIDTYVQEETGIEFKDIRVWKTPVSLTLCYSYRLPKEIYNSETAEVTVGPSVMYKNAVSFIETVENVSGEEWIVCKETIPSVSEPYKGKMIITVSTDKGVVLSELPLQTAGN